MSIHTLTPQPAQSIQLTAVSRTEWTVVDTRVSPHESESLVGFIEKVGDRFEVMEFGDPMTFYTTGSMTAALARLSRCALPAVPPHAA